MASFVKQAIGEGCFVSLFEKFDVANASCLKILLSKMIGYGIVAGSVMFKVPQILKIHGARSVEGLSLLSFFLELLAFTITGLYSFSKGFAVSTYGESVSASAQNVVILLLFFRYGRGSAPVAVAGLLAAYFGLVASTLAGLVPLHVLEKLFQLTIPLVIVGRVPQIWTSFARRSTGQLSIITTALQFGGSLGRIFTTIQEVNDPLVLTGYLVGLTLNAIMLLQFVLFWKNTSTEAKKKAKAA
eukprot:ANDGO_00658.mRNA.1 Mannose-P-dolichol utilization defect 1 protein homolog